MPPKKSTTTTTKPLKTTTTTSKSAAAKKAIETPKPVVVVPKLRKEIVPGQVLILLAGPYKGKRVIFMKQLQSGLLLVTGIIGINGIPTRRVNQNYVVVTPTVLDYPTSIDSVVEGIDDAFFDRMKIIAKKQLSKQKRIENAMGKVNVTIPRNTERLQVQKAVESVLKPAVVSMGKEYVSYLGASFQF